uniref:Uncharacterized protein n=1 Tax=Cacopsylla melanoneura TaxID=428564 RepID=A0A8D8W4N8_9HEMI
MYVISSHNHSNFMRICQKVSATHQPTKITRNKIRFVLEFLLFYFFSQGILSSSVKHVNSHEHLFRQRKRDLNKIIHSEPNVIFHKSRHWVTYFGSKVNNNFTFHNVNNFSLKLRYLLPYL